MAALPLTSGTFGAAVVVLLYNEKRQPVKGWRFGPSGESRTHGLLNPIQARYQTALHPVNRAVSNQLYYYSGFEGECQQDFAKNIIFAFFRAKRCINPTADA